MTRSFALLLHVLVLLQELLVDYRNMVIVSWQFDILYLLHNNNHTAEILKLFIYLPKRLLGMFSK